jgi:D-alanyl-lipoteichoic acid acyltransferase DltB (MBOAT superfamily)
MLYYVIPAKYKSARNLFLLVVSYALYVSWKPVFALVLLTVTAVTFWGGLVFDVRCKKEEVRETLPSQRKRLIWLFALLGLLPLLFFKYYNFLNESISEGMAAIGMQFALPGLNWAVPIGISFFTFQSVGYMLDVYYGRISAERNFLNYALFISFFPSILSGPINKALS